LVAESFPQDVIALFATRDPQAPSTTKDRPAAYSGFLSFEGLFQDTEFASSMRELCRNLQNAYSYPVDIEFTANFTPDGKFRINLLQCRPFQVKIGGEGSQVNPPDEVDPHNLLLQSRGPIVGHSLATVVDRLIYVVPSVYSQMSINERHSVARLVGKLTHLDPPENHRTIMLLGPGRWGTSMPSLGVPVTFAEINTVSVICELALMHAGLVPDVSLGTHFFNDLVEMDMLYLAVSPGRAGNQLNEEFLARQPNQLSALLPAAHQYAQAVLVIDSAPHPGGEAVFLNVDSMKQEALCYWAKRSGSTA
jgi:pyruvate, water dikinase